VTALTDALSRHAAGRPEVPWLFWAEGWDWRWLSWGEAARRVEAEAAAFAGLPAGAHVPFLYHPAPASLLTDLAIQAAGRVPLPLVEGAPPPAVEEHGGEVMVWMSGGEWVEWSREDLLAAAAAVGRAVAPAGPPLGGREILVSCRSLAEPAERAVLAWALLEGAALLLEPDPASFTTTVAWARPTFFHGTAAEITTLWRLAESAPQPLARLLLRPPGLPFGRLRVVLAVGDEPPPADRMLWNRRGVLLTPSFVPPR
jgi:hypothetical protein